MRLVVPPAWGALTALAALASPARAQQPPAPSAPVANVAYELTFDSASAARRTVHVQMSFDVAGSDSVVLALPAWTPGAYELDFFARKVSGFAVSEGGQTCRWDKLDYQTWRVRPTGAGRVSVNFDVLADTLDNAQAWAQPDFLLLNGTNVFLYPTGGDLGFPATVTLHTEPDWRVATGMHAAGAPRTYREANYHDLVDMPFFIGRFDLDSELISGKTTRLASYPAGFLADSSRAVFWDALRRVIPPESAVFGVTPWDNYSVMVIFSQGYPGGSALEHQSSHVGVYAPGLRDDPYLPDITAHEIFHAWNVKRLRPADMMPYRYAGPDPTSLLWVSEGFTDYYADIAMERGGLWDSTAFLNAMADHFRNVEQAPPTAPEDASLSTWIHPTDGSEYLYYDQGACIGFLLDILIRDGSNNHQSLDGVMRGLYQDAYLHGRGFTTAEFWAAVSRAAGRPLDDFGRRYVDASAPFPVDDVLPRAGLRWVRQVTQVPRMGVSTSTDSTGSHVVGLVPGGAFEAAGVKVGDLLLSVGGIDQRSDVQANEFRRRFAGRAGESYPVVVRREGRDTTLTAVVRMGEQVDERIDRDSTAGAKARAVLAGLLAGRTDR